MLKDFSALSSWGNVADSGVEASTAPISAEFPEHLLAETTFRATVEQARRLLPGLVAPFADRVGAILKARQEILLCRNSYPGMRAELDALMPSRFLESVSFERLMHFPRYLKAMLIRAERAVLNPLKDQEKARQVAPFVEQFQKLASTPKPSTKAQGVLDEFRWMIEEFKVSTFAQELGTRQPVSAKRLQNHLETARTALLAG